jgi:two-component system sensor histidine kinase/response regulator
LKSEDKKISFSIDSGSISSLYSKFYLDVIMDEVYDILEKQACEKGLGIIISIEPDVPLNVEGDKTKLKQILTNFISNALIFSEVGNVVVNISLDYLLDSHLVIQFSIINKCVCIGSKALRGPSEPFTKPENPLSEYGINPVPAKRKQYLKIMGREVHIESVLGRCGAFCFTVKLKKCGTDDRFRFTEKQLNPRILLIEENDQIQNQIINYLKRLSFDCFVPESFKGEKDLVCNENDLHPIVLIGEDYFVEKGILNLIDEVAKKIVSDAEIIILASREESVKRSVENEDFFLNLLRPVKLSELYEVLCPPSPEIEKSQLYYESPGKTEYIEHGSDISGVRILVVEDNFINQQVVVELLETEGIMVTVADSGLEALQLVKVEGYFDMILMDLRMPGWDGFKTTKRIKQIRGFENTPIIALSAYVAEDVKMKALEAGMCDYVSKPFSLEEFIPVLHKWVNPVKTKNKSNTDILKLQNDVSFPRIEGVDVSLGLKNLNNNYRKYQKLLFFFKDEYIGFYNKTKHDLGLEGYNELSVYIHTLKGVCGNIGATGLHMKTELFEVLILENDKLKINECIKEIGQELHNISLSIESALNI